MSDIKRFTAYVKPYRRTIFAGVFFILCSMSFSLLVPSLVGMAIDALAQDLSWEKIIFYPLVILGANLMSGFFLFWQRRLLINSSRHIEFDMRRDFYSALVDQPLEYFQNTRIGDLMARATNDLSAIRQIVGPMLLYSFQAIFALAITLPILFNISVKLTLLMLIPLPFVSLTVKYLGQQVHVRFEKIQEYFSDITARVQENLSGVRVVRAYAREESEIKEFQELNAVFAQKNLQLVKYSAAMRPLMFFFIGLGFVIIVAIGVPMAVNGEITAGQFTAFMLYLQRMVWYLIALGYVVNLYQRGKASLKRFNTVLDAKPDIADDANAVEQTPIRGDIEFRDLTFAYSGHQPVLENIDLKIEQGSTVALVGKTGSGKSTIVNLIPRLLDAPGDSILIDGKPIRHFPLSQLRRSIGFVPQESFLFSDTLAANISFGLKDEEKGDRSYSVEKAAEIACLADDIKNFPGKYEQLVGERGITLSGGQKQRTAIARAVIRDPKILILDDSLSAVDTYTEEKILSNLRDVRTGRTTIIVAHRISTIKDADLICVLDNGRIIERGTHEELLRLKGEYSELYRRQLLEDEIVSTH